MINSENWTIIDEILNSVASVYGWKDFYLPEITSDSDFFVKESKGMVRFQFSPDGKVKGFISNGMKATKIE